MLVDGHAGLQAELVIGLMTVVPAVFPSGIFEVETQFAFPLHVVDFLLQSRNAHAEVVQLVGEFRRQLVQHRLVHAGRVLRHSAGNHLRHFVARDFLIAAIGAVAVAFDDTVGGELGNGVIRPMVGRDVLERIRRGERRRGRADDKRGRQRGNDGFFHLVFPPIK